MDNNNSNNQLFETSKRSPLLKKTLLKSETDKTNKKNESELGWDDANMNDPSPSLSDRIQLLQERMQEISTFIETLKTLMGKMEQKKKTIKSIISEKIDDNIKELNKWKEILFVTVDESIDEKIEKLQSQKTFFETTSKEIESVIKEVRSGGQDESDGESEDPKLEDLLALDLVLQPEGVSPAEVTELDSGVKKEFSKVLNEPKKSLRRTFAYVGGIIRGYLRRGKSNINWIKIMRKLEGRDNEDSKVAENDPFLGSKISTDVSITYISPNVSNTWETMRRLFENKLNPELRAELCKDLYKCAETNPEDVLFYLPQLCYLLLNQYNEFPQLKEFILNQCSNSFHFALQTYLLVRAAKDSRAPPKKKKVIPPSLIDWRVTCNTLLGEVQGAAQIFIRTSSIEDPFKAHIEFMDSLISISQNLYTNTVPTQYSIELEKQLKIVDDKLQELTSLQDGTFIYIPLLKPIGVQEIHKIVRIPYKEAFPIPTFSRVLYHMVIEIVDEKPKKKHKKKREKKVQEQLPEEEEKLDYGFYLGDGTERDEELMKKKNFGEENHKKFELLNGDGEISPNSVSPKKKKPSLAEDEISNLASSPKKKFKTEEDEKKKKRKEEKKSSSLSSDSSNSISISSSSDLVTSFPSHQPLGSHTAFGELWEKRVKRIKKDSAFGSLERWRSQPIIVKFGDEVLQEEFAMQLIVQFQRIFSESNIPVVLCPYRILAVSPNSGLIEPIPNSLSLDKLKKQHTNLLNFFIQAFGDTSEPSFKQAQQNFVKSMAGYSVVCYLLQIKDRHNGNILLDASGNLIHIDFGYLLSKTIKFEKAPFKLTMEFVEVMGGYDSPCYKQYCRLCTKAYLAARKHYSKIVNLIEMTIYGKGRKVLPCLKDIKLIEDLQNRFHLDWTDEKCEQFMMELIEEARGSWRTIVYDAYQLILNNIH